jgi:putative flippase GtrA
MPPVTGIYRLVRKHETKFRFILVGAWNTIFGYGAFLLLETLFSRLFPANPLSYMAAMVSSNVIAVLNAFLFHKYITFRSRVRDVAVFAEFIRFSSTYLLTFLLSLFLLPAFIEILGLSTRVAGALVILVCTIVSYIGHSRFSFRNRRIR